MNTTTVKIDGFVFNLLNNPQEAMERNLYTNHKHSNNIISLFLEGIYFSKTERYFDQSSSIAITKVLLQNKNCYDINFLGQLKDLSANLLSKSDYLAHKSKH